jgi:hypothetical protein
MAKLQEQLNLEHKIKTGAENMLQLYQSNPQIDPEAVNKIKQQLMSANAKIECLTKQYEEYKTKRESSMFEPLHQTFTIL